MSTRPPQNGPASVTTPPAEPPAPTAATGAVGDGTLTPESAGASGAEHVPVLADEALDGLAVAAGGRYVDATYGRGGHSGRVLERLGPAGRLLAVDRDPDAVADARRRHGDDPRFGIVRADFAALGDVLGDVPGDASDGWGDWHGTLDGLLLDLGVSSPQLDVAERGFGFSRDGALDMRMDPDSGSSAAEWLATVDEDELATVIREYGEERHARRIAGAIVAARGEAPLTRTAQLADVVKRAHPRWERHHHPATRTFQAIRIRVNDELGALRAVLADAAAMLRVGGRLAVISFHSLEDRIVKRALRRPPPDARVPRHLPQPPAAPHPWRALGKARRASDAELARNPRARSATLRVAERVEVAA